MNAPKNSEKLRQKAKDSGFKTKVLAEVCCVGSDTMRQFLGGHRELGDAAKKLLNLFLDGELQK